MDSNKQGFPQVLRTWGKGDFQKLCFFLGGGGWGLSQYMRGAWGAGFQEKGKCFINICTVACRLKTFIFSVKLKILKFI